VSPPLARCSVGCAVLYDGQGRFHGSTAATVDYVVRQSGDTVSNLRGFTGFLQTAKAASVGPVTLPPQVKDRIDHVVPKVSAAAAELAARTSSNAARIRDALETVYVTKRSFILFLFLLFHGIIKSLNNRFCFRPLQKESSERC
jgi:hypothetical protein